MNCEWRRQLEDYGVDVSHGIDSHMGNEEMFVRIFNMVMDDQNFSILFERQYSTNPMAIFEVAHSLKGTLGNVGLSEIDEIITKICEVTRGGSIEQVSEYIETIKQLYKRLKEVV